jgi:RNA polymerase sigma factor (sigma-70 family)
MNVVKMNSNVVQMPRIRSRLTTLFYKKFAASQSSFSFAGESDDNDTTSGDSKSKKPKTKEDFRSEFERLHPRGPDGKFIEKNGSDKVKKTTIRKPASSKSKSTTSNPATAKPASPKAKAATLPLFDESTGEANINPDGTLKAKLREALQRAIDTRKDVVSKSSPAISVVHSSTSQPSPEFLDSLTKSRKQLEILAKLKRIDRKADYGVDDFVQDVSILAAKNHTTFDPAKGKFTTWIGRIANNHAISLFRNSKRLKRDSGPMMSISSTWDDNKKDGSSASLADGIADYRGSGDSNNQSEIEAIRSHVENLPKRMRTVIRDRFLNGKSIQEIQKKLGHSRQAIYDAIRDGLQRIREEMQVGERDKPKQAERPPETLEKYSVFKTKVDGQDRWAVVTENSVGKRAGHELHHNEESATKAAKAEKIKDDSHQAAQQAKQEKADFDKKADLERNEKVYAFTANMTPPQKKKAIDALDKSMMKNGQLITRRQIVEDAIAQKATIKSHPKFGKILEYPNGAFIEESRLSKTAMDYAEFRMSKNPAETKPDNVSNYQRDRNEKSWTR